ncbi:uncharacterized protein LOC107365764 [Tetranychus urticae]|uniref:ER-bound oxygenase mpaB/mpaB'/Rubber oxygenase catalytic domain-containing protein n=1 Tax=Tetranychus urticae TaxID=32264 RepID=T1KNV4_TETUR|nr:uncharacterized protein LOC107365764 [Tetranychus urticae]
MCKKTDLKEKAKTKYQLLVDEASYLPAVCDTFDPTKPPDWYDKDKLAQSQQTCMKYFYSSFVSILMGNLLAFQGSSFLKPVLTTGNHETIAKIYRRYLATAVHMQKWFTSDPFVPDSPAYKSFSQVRQMHIKLCLSMNKQMEKEVGVHKLHSSLYDIILSEFPFVGLFVNYPEACGAHGITREELEQVLYTWRVFGYALGVDDKYNVCDGSLEDFRELYKQFEEQYFVPILSKVPDGLPIGWAVSKGYITALKEINASLNFNVSVHFWFDIIGVPVSIPLNFYEWILLKINNFVTYYMLRSRFFYTLVNKFVMAQTEKHKKRREIVTRDLERRYNDIKFEPDCPRNEDPDYPSDLD